jgi:hypothetical protein
MKFRFTERRFARFDFIDRYGEECAIQDSSLASEAAIWLGVNDNRMHLTREQVAELVPILQRFLDTDSIVPLEESCTQS